MNKLTTQLSIDIPIKHTKPKIAFIDDEERILRSLKMHFRDTHDVFITTDPQALINYVSTHDVKVVVSDQRMPKQLGTEVLRAVKEASPHTVRILLTGYADLNAVIHSINEGEIFRYITKPWHTDELKNVVQQATDIATQTKQAFDETIQTSTQPLALRRVLVLDDNELVYQQMRQQFGHLIIDWAYSLERAVQLLEQQQYGVAITDVSLGGENISPVIFNLKQQFPELAVLVLTELKDAHTLIDLINKGQVYRYLPRPTNLPMLELSIQRAFDYHQALVNQPKLQLRHTVSEITETEKVTLSDKVKGFFARFRGRKTTMA
ncbi:MULTISPECIES: response regulator [unclassified Moraxella]|uniref:response regulator n=1 Tax=unclassified Moraxella TaxID=2685852 RepID=UPI003AF5B1E5